MSCRYLGMDPEQDADLMYIAGEAALYFLIFDS